MNTARYSYVDLVCTIIHAHPQAYNYNRKVHYVMEMNTVCIFCCGRSSKGCFCVCRCEKGVPLTSIQKLPALQDKVPIGSEPNRAALRPTDLVLPDFRE